MNNQIKFIFLSILFITSLLPMQLHSQTTFTLKEYEIKDSSFYQELHSVLFSDTVFGMKDSSKYILAMRYDTTAKYIDYLTGETFSASFNIFDLMDGASILKTTDTGRNTIGYFCIENITCFILKSIQADFISQYLSSTDKKERFQIYDSFPIVGGFTSIYMNILPKGKIEVVRILKSE